MADSMGLPYSMGLHGSFFPDMKCLGEDIRFAIAAAATNLDALGRRESFLETRTRTRTSDKMWYIWDRLLADLDAQKGEC